MTTNENFLKAARHIGWGDLIKDGLCFIGIEETLKWDPAALARLGDPDANGVTFDEWAGYGESADPNKSERTQTSIPNWQSKIACQLSSSSPDWRVYRDQMLWRKGSGVFSTNLFPLGRRSGRDWPENYQSLFELGPEDATAYFNAVREHRFPPLHQFISDQKPAAVVGFGKTCWPEFRKLLKLEESEADTSVPKIEIYAKEPGVILVPFFGWGHMSKSVADSIALVLKSWSVKLK